MTEKRFYIAESNLIEGYCVFDREKKYAFHPRPRKADCLNDAHILNELHDENEQLKTKNNAYLQDIEMFKEENTTLKLENQELHQLNKEYVDSLSDEKKETLSEILNSVLGDDGND